MSHYRLAAAWRGGPSDQTAAARIRVLPRLAAGALIASIGIAGITSALVWSRTVMLRDEAYPALTDIRQLSSLLVATQDALRRDGGSEPARADSLAEQFHRVAETAVRRRPISDGVRTAEGEFHAYYAQARRRAGGADGLSDLTFRSLRSQLDAMEAVTRERIDAANSSIERLPAIGGIAMVLVAFGAIAALVAIAGAASRAAEAPIETAAERAVRIAEGDFTGESGDASRDAAGNLQRALDRIASTMRANRSAAELLAKGEYRLHTGDALPADQTGRALARLAAYLDYVSIAAQRIAEGDLGAVVEPRSADDALGQACTMMVQRVVTALRDAEATAQLVGAGAAEVQRVAAELVRAAGEDAAGIGRVADEVASIRSALQRSATRATDVERRVVESASAMQDGTIAIQESLASLQEISQRVAVVEHLSHDAGLIALNAGVEVGRAGPYGAGFVAIAGEVRSLSARAGAAAREMGTLSARSSESTARSAESLARVLPVVSQGLDAARDLADGSAQRAGELANVEREMSAARDAGRRAVSAAQALAIAADALAGQADRLAAAFKGFGVAPDDVRPESPAAALAAGSRERRRPAGRRLALV